jgi:AbrB family looped-hinge helix DNA binding protein
MRITSKGQVTIPVDIREAAGLVPDTEVEFVHEGGGQVRLFRVAPKTCRKSRGEKLVEHMRGKATRTLTTEQIMALTRGD